MRRIAVELFDTERDTVKVKVNYSGVLDKSLFLFPFDGYPLTEDDYPDILMIYDDYLSRKYGI